MTQTPPTLTERLARRAAAAPDAVAVVVDEGDALTYGRWQHDSDAVARGLLARGVVPGERVALRFDHARWPDFAVCYLAVLKAGAVAVPLAAQLTAGEQRRVLTGCAAAAVVAPGDLGPRSGGAWTADPQELAGDADDDVPLPAVRAGSAAEMLYPTGVLRPPNPQVLSHDDVAADRPGGLASADAWLVVHGLPVGSRAAQQALRWPLLVDEATVTVLSGVDLARLCALVAGRPAVLGIGSALVRALLDAAVARGDLAAASGLLVDRPLPPAVRAGLRAAFPGAALLGAAGEPTQSPTGQPPAAGVAPAPLTPAQDGVAWYEHLVPGALNLPPLVRRYQGALDVAALERALAEIVRRHETLRTTYELAGSRIVQLVHPAKLSLPIDDLSALTPGEQDAEVDRLVAEAAVRHLDPVTEVAFQPRLLRLADDDHVLVVPGHHICWDDWSGVIFRRELAALYGAFRAGDLSPLADLPVQFTDYARRERDRLDGPDGDAQRAFWTRELGDGPLTLQLPIDDPALPAGSPQRPGGPVRLELPAVLAEQLRALARGERVTLYMLSLAAFSVLAQRYTGQDDVLVAAAVANRNRPELEGLIGCFAKKVPVRVSLAGDPTVRELLTRVRAALTRAWTHQDLAFEEALQAALGVDAACHGVVPTVTVTFQGLVARGRQFDLPGLRSVPFESAAVVANPAHFVAGAAGRAAPAAERQWGAGLYRGAYLRVMMLEGADGVSFAARGLFHDPAVRRLLDHLHGVLTAMVADPFQTVAELGRRCVHDDDELLDRPGDGGVDLRGFRVDAAELEAAVATLPGVRDVAVVARGEPPRLVAYVVAEGARPPSLNAARLRVWQRLPGHAWPAALVGVDTLPRRADGRVDAAALPDPHEPASHEVAAPDEHRLLASAWADVLGVERIGGEDTYWQSFDFVEAATRLAQAGVPITARHVTRNRTLATLAAALRRDAAGRR